MRRLMLGLLSAGLALAVGCARQPYLTPERLAKGLVIVLPGVEGESPLNRAICDGLDAGGVDWGIDLQNWTSPWGPLINLRAEIHNRRTAREIAIRIAEYKFAHPRNPVVLVGQSAGGAMALWITEQMPEGQNVDGLVLLAPAISPGYMVDFALSKTNRGAINFYSAKDWLFLGVLTTVYGTMDGEHTSSAGRVGFMIPAASARPKAYDRLFQIAWHQQMAAAGHTGGHLESSAEAFVRHYVAPFVLARRWDEELVAGVLTGRKIDAQQPTSMTEWKPMVTPKPPAAGAADRPATAPATR